MIFAVYASHNPEDFADKFGLPEEVIQDMKRHLEKEKEKKQKL